MGNYRDLERDFIERTLRLIDQYYQELEKHSFEHQYNYTLTINCLLGLIVMPKERAVSFIPTYRLTDGLRNEMGLKESQFGEHLTSLRELVQELRHSVAHFDISVISENHGTNLIDWLEFRNSEKDNRLVARFRAPELLPFLKYYASCLVQNLERFRK